MLRTLRIWTFGAFIGAVITTEWLWGEAERALAREYHQNRSR